LPLPPGWVKSKEKPTYFNIVKQVEVDFHPADTFADRLVWLVREHYNSHPEEKKAMKNKLEVWDNLFRKY
jgi:hypothetical protein